MADRDRIVLGTRGSDLARTQTALVEAALRPLLGGQPLEVRVIRTRGDERGAVPAEEMAGRKGMFTAEIERALAAGEVDLAVHSAKDLPSAMGDEFRLAAVLPRAATEDLLLARQAVALETLAHGATVATGSVRRQRQLRWQRPDLLLADLRGNVPTRLRKLSGGAHDAMVLARAGLERLGFDCSGDQIVFEGENIHLQRLDPALFVPAGGQGVIAVQARADDAFLLETAGGFNDAETMTCLRLEREFLRLLEGDCGTPVGVAAAVAAGGLKGRVQLFQGEAAAPIMVEAEGSPDDPEGIARELMEKIHGEKREG